MAEIKFKDLLKEMPYKFKPQAIRFGKATMVSYIDARDVQDRLDEVCCPANWQSDYKVIDGNMYCGIAVNVGTTEDSRWIWKWDCGTESNMEKEKGQASDAFKRAAVQWGVGRFLYRLGIVELKAVDYKGKEKPAKDDGSILWNNNDITEYIMKYKLKNTTKSKSEKSPKTEKYEKTDGKPTYTKNAYSQEIIERVGKMSSGGKTGKECIKHFLPKFCEDTKKDYKSLVDLDNDTKLKELLDYIDQIEPENI